MKGYYFYDQASFIFYDFGYFSGVTLTLTSITFISFDIRLILFKFVCLKKWNNCSWCYINKCQHILPLFYKRYSETFCNSIKDHLQLRGDLFKVSCHVMSFFLWNSFSVIKDVTCHFVITATLCNTWRTL